MNDSVDHKGCEFEGILALVKVEPSDLSTSVYKMS